MHSPSLDDFLRYTPVSPSIFAYSPLSPRISPFSPYLCSAVGYVHDASSRPRRRHVDLRHIEAAALGQCRGKFDVESISIAADGISVGLLNAPIRQVADLLVGEMGHIICYGDSVARCHAPRPTCHAPRPTCRGEARFTVGLARGAIRLRRSPCATRRRRTSRSCARGPAAQRRDQRARHAGQRPPLAFWRPAAPRQGPLARDVHHLDMSACAVPLGASPFPREVDPNLAAVERARADIAKLKEVGIEAELGEGRFDHIRDENGDGVYHVWAGADGGGGKYVNGIYQPNHMENDGIVSMLATETLEERARGNSANVDAVAE